MAVNREDVERIIASVPGFQTSWGKFLKLWEAEKSLPYYLGMGELAHYVVENYAQGTTVEFTDLFSCVENLLNDPDPELENLIAVGLFEDMQSVASHRDFGGDVFKRWLGTRSLVVWDEIDAGIQQVSEWAERQQPRWWQFWRRRKTFDAEKALSQVENPELKKIIESMYRKKQ